MSDSVPVVNDSLSFRDLELIEPLIQNLERAGYETPTPIQAKAIPPLLAGRDVVGQAQTGTGKTAAFALPLLQRLDLKLKQPQILVLTPTRELALQVAKAFGSYASDLGNVRIAAVYGGQDYQIQFRQLDFGAQIIIGTPGRVMDHMRRGSLKLDALQTLVLDEADEMLRMGFAEDVEWVMTQCPSPRQTALFSATLPEPIRRIAQQHLQNPVEVTIRQQTATADTIRQRYVLAAPHQKQAVLGRILEAEPVDGAIVFVRTRMTSEPLADFLNANGKKAAALHGEIAQKQRERIVEKFRSGELDVLVATDVAARGLDVQRVSHVFNYDLPFDSEAYVHRIGRTGRAGRSGEAILFVHPRERRLLGRLEQATRQTIEPMEVPSNRAINKQRVARLRERIQAAMLLPQMDQHLSVLEHFQEESGLPMLQIAAALSLLAHGDQPLMVKDEFQQARFVDDRPARGADRGPGGDRGPRGRTERDRFRIEVGRMHQVLPGNIVGAIANEAGLLGREIGRIDIFDDHSLVDLPAGMPADVFHRLKNVQVCGQLLNISHVDNRGPRFAPSGREEGDRRPSKPKRKAVVAN